MKLNNPNADWFIGFGIFPLLCALAFGLFFSFTHKINIKIQIYQMNEVHFFLLLFAFWDFGLSSFRCHFTRMVWLAHIHTVFICQISCEISQTICDQCRDIYLFSATPINRYPSRVYPPTLIFSMQFIHFITILAYYIFIPKFSACIILW